MPRVCEFYGISIYIDFGDHAPPHFHALYGGSEASIRIGDGLSWRANCLPEPSRSSASGPVVTQRS